jgi:hypothetical protein
MKVKYGSGMSMTAVDRLYLADSSVDIAQHFTEKYTFWWHI